MKPIDTDERNEAADERNEAASGGDIARLRARMDDLDRRIVALLNERAALGIEIGRAKASAGRVVIRDAEREREVLRRVTSANDGPIDDAALLALYREIIDLTRRLEEVDRERDHR